MALLLADAATVWTWIGGIIGVIVLLVFIMALPDIARYIRIKSM